MTGDVVELVSERSTHGELELSLAGLDSRAAAATATRGDADRARVVRASVIGVVAGLVPFLAVLWDLRLDPLRTARVERFASNFYDLQARALFDGHLHLPDGMLGIEGFVHHGRTFMYFPPFPALLRMPVLLVTDSLDGRLTAPSMLLAWAVFAVASVFLVWRARRLVRGSAPVSRFDGVACGVLIAAITGGTVVLYIAALPWIYHEVYLWSAALTVGALAGFAAIAERGVAPARRHIVVVAVCVMGTVLTRATAGWPLAVTTVVFGTWMAIRATDRNRRAGLALVAAGVVPLLVSSAIGWVKFRHPYMIPLENQVWTQRNARRRLALMINDGSLASVDFLPTTIVNYFRPDGIRFTSTFPFVTFPAEPASAYAGAFIDQRYRTGSVPAFMPLLFLLSIWGFVVTFARSTARRMAVPLIGALGVTITVMCYGYIGFRYTSEFAGVLAAASAIGLADVTRRVAGRGALVRRSVLAVVVSLAAFSVFANAAVAIPTARQTARGAALEQYVAWQDRVSSITGNPLADITRQVDELPPSAPPDELFVIGDCDALYLSTGDLYEPWVTVQLREMIVVVEASGDGYRSVLLPMVDISRERPARLTLETDATEQRVRLRVGDEFRYLPTDWQPLAAGGTIELRLSADTARDRIDVAFGDWSGGLDLADWNPQWTVTLTRPAFTLAPVADQLRAGIGLTSTLGPELELCNRLLDRAD